MGVGIPNEDWIVFEGAGDRVPGDWEATGSVRKHQENRRTTRRTTDAPLAITGNLLRYPAAAG